MALTLRDWQHDSEVLKDAVLDVVHRKLKDHSGVENWHQFLREINIVLNAAEANQTLNFKDRSRSVKVFRAILESLQLVFQKLDRVEDWGDAEFYVLRQIELIENALRF